MILIKNRQKSKINETYIKKSVNKILKKLGYPNFDIGFWFTTNKTIQKYNKQFLQKNKSTDVLSFPFHTKINPGEHINVITPDDKNLGDILISVEFCKKDAKTFNIPFDEYLLKIIIIVS